VNNKTLLLKFVPKGLYPYQGHDAISFGEQDEAGQHKKQSNNDPKKGILN